MRARLGVRGRWLASLLLAGGAVIAATLVWASADGQVGGGSADRGVRMAMSSSDGAIEIANSKAGHAILTATDLVPGEAAEGDVVIGNPNDVPIALRLRGEAIVPGPMADALELTVAGAGDRLYRGPLAGLGEIGAGTLQPDEARTFRFVAGLPAAAGNALQGASTGIDLIWHATGDAPPPECKLRAVRSRLFIYRGRPAIRLVARYRANAPGRVTLDFYERDRRGRRGAKVGRLTTRFGRSVDRWRMKRVRRHRSERQVSRFRRSRSGFVVRLRVAGAPGHCARRMNLELSQLRRVDRQFVWFQRGSFRRMP